MEVGQPDKDHSGTDFILLHHQFYACIPIDGMSRMASQLE